MRTYQFIYESINSNHEQDATRSIFKQSKASLNSEYL